jgi:hypothetical protein
LIFVYSLYLFTKILLAFRLGESSATRNPDTLDYFNYAENFWTVFFDKQLIFGELGLLRTPAYPFLLHIIGGENWIIVILIHNLFVIGASLLIFQVVSQFSTKRIAVISALIPLLDPGVFIESTYLLTETMLMFLITFAIWIPFTSSGNLLRGTIFALTILVLPLIKPIALFFIPFLVWHYRAVTLSKFRTLFYISIVPISGLFLYAIKNLFIYGVPRISSIDSLNLLYYEGAYLESLANGMDLAEVQVTLSIEEKQLDVKGSSIHGVIDFRTERGAELIRENIIYAPYARAIGLIKLLFGTGATSIRNWLSAFPQEVVFSIIGAGIVFLITVNIATFIGVFSIISTKNRTFVPLFLLFFVALVLSSGANAYSRFRVPLVPMIAIFVALGISYMQKRRRNRIASRE